MTRAKRLEGITDFHGSNHLIGRPETNAAELPDRTAVRPAHVIERGKGGGKLVGRAPPVNKQRPEDPVKIPSTGPKSRPEGNLHGCIL